jgi:DNA-binding CsgD family transcriptional regulator
VQIQTNSIWSQEGKPAEAEFILRSGLVKFAAHIERYDSPASLLDALDEAVAKESALRVLGARRYGVNVREQDPLTLGENIFIHKSAPAGWWDDYLAVSQKPGTPPPVITMARHGMAPFTWSESLRIFEPVGVDRWAYEVGLKHGIRDGLTCPVAGSRWVMIYWSRKPLSERLSPELRALLFMAANFAVIRLERLVGLDAKRIGRQVSLTPRELSVLRMASTGMRTRRIADMLELGEETVRSHLKKAQMKLDAKDRLHAVAQALRLQLIP